MLLCQKGLLSELKGKKEQVRMMASREQKYSIRKKTPAILKRTATPRARVLLNE